MLNDGHRYLSMVTRFIYDNTIIDIPSSIATVYDRKWYANSIGMNGAAELRENITRLMKQKYDLKEELSEFEE
jgi:hypothetical protein